MGGCFEMTEQERLIVGKHQMAYYLSNQYPMWRVVLMHSIKRIIDDLEGFYSPIKETIRQYDTEVMDDTIRCEVRNGLFFEALSHSVQAIEDLFSLMHTATDLSFFAKKVVTYYVTNVNNYIKDFDTTNTEYMLNQFQVPYFNLSEPWEHKDVFNGYKESVLLIKEFLDELIAHHKKYYISYCQYKHGLSVSLRRYGADGSFVDNPHVNAVVTFDNKRFDKRYTNNAPAFVIPSVIPEIGKNIGRLHKEGNLLRIEMQLVDINKLIDITEKAYNLTIVLHSNLNRLIGKTGDEQFDEIYFPTRDHKKVMTIGFPKE